MGRADVGASAVLEVLIQPDSTPVWALVAEGCGSEHTPERGSGLNYGDWTWASVATKTVSRFTVRFRPLRPKCMGT